MEDEWFDETHIMDVAPKNISKMSEAMAAEVCFIPHHVSILITFLYRDQHGILLGQVAVQLASHRVLTKPHRTRVVVQIMW
jgi:hypothetical protein